MKTAPKRGRPATAVPKRSQPLTAAPPPGRRKKRRARKAAAAAPPDRPATRGRPPARKRFTLHWGKGIIEEEVQVATPHHRPTIQLLRFLEGEMAGRYEIRFCHYDHEGRFQRSPLIVSEKDLAALRRALLAAPKLRRLLAKLV